MMDLNTKAKAYLKELGVFNRGGKIGPDLVIWCRYEGLKCTAVGPTEESVTPVYKE